MLFTLRFRMMGQRRSQGLSTFPTYLALGVFGMQVAKGIFGRYHRWLLPVLVAMEAAVVVASVFIGSALRFGDFGAIPDEWAIPLWPRALVFAVVTLLCLTATGLYNPRLRDGFGGVLFRLGVSLLLAAAIMTLLFYTFPGLFLGRGAFALSLFVALVALSLLRAGYLRLLRKGNNRRYVLVLGAGRRAGHILRFRRNTDFIGVHFVGFVRMPGDEPLVPDERLLTLDAPLPQYAVAHGIDQVIIAGDERRGNLPMRDLLDCRTRGVEVTELASFIEREIGLLKLDAMDPGWLIFSPGFNHRVLRRWMKQLFDLAASLILLIPGLPLMTLAALAIWLESGGRGPILIRQARVGEEGIPFELYKFRSMRVDAEGDGQARWAVTGDARVTRVGAFIRRYRIDELPQIFNVIAGRMSFVGPRPERPEFVVSLTQTIPYYAERHRVKPGLTGWAQVRYPYGGSERAAFEKLQFDLYYAKNHNLLLDIGILLQTVEVVLWGRGAR